MNSILHINISAFPMILLAVIYVSMLRKSIQTNDMRMFMRLVLMTFLMLTAELISWIVDGIGGKAMCFIGWLMNIVYFGLMPFVAVTWFRYIYFNIKDGPVDDRARIRFIPSFVILGCYCILLLSSPWTGWVFTLASDNQYVRGPLFWLPYAIFLACMIAAVIVAAISCRGKGTLYRRHYIRLAGYAMIPIIAAAVQVVFEYSWIMLPATAISELLFYIYIQQQMVKKDALTGINNRGCFNDYLLSQLEQEDTRNTLCLFMIDLDQFKLINDTLGHVTGDSALIAAAGVLSNYMHGTNAFLARYGGDEFCVVKRCETTSDAMATAAGIKDAFEEYSKSDECKYALSCCVGFARYGEDGAVTPERLIHIADMMLYRNKKERQ